MPNEKILHELYEDFKKSNPGFKSSEQEFNSKMKIKENRTHFYDSYRNNKNTSYELLDDYNKMDSLLGYQDVVQPQKDVTSYVDDAGFVAKAQRDAAQQKSRAEKEKSAATEGMKPTDFAAKQEYRENQFNDFAKSPVSLIPTENEATSPIRSKAIGSSPFLSASDLGVSVDVPEYVKRGEKTLTDIQQNAFERALNIEGGKESFEEIDKKYKEEFKNSEELKKILKNASGKSDEQLNKELNDAYEKYSRKANQEFFDTFVSENMKDYLEVSTEKLFKKNLSSSVPELEGEIKKDIESLKTKSDKPFGFTDFVKSVSQAEGSNGISSDVLLSDVKDKDAYKTLRTALDYTQKTKDLIDSAKDRSFVKAFGHEFGKTITNVDTWDFGISQLMNSEELMHVVGKIDKSGIDSLTPAENKMMTAAAQYMAASAYYSNEIGRGAKAGQSTAASMPFIIQFMLTDGATSALRQGTKGVAKKVLEWATKKFTSKVPSTILKSGVTKAVGKSIATAAADFVSANVMATVLDQPKIISGMHDRELGEIVPEYNRETERFEYKGHDVSKSQSPLEAYRNSFFDSAIERWSEMAFNALGPIGEEFGKFLGASKFFNKMSSSAIGRFIANARGNQTFKGFKDSTQFHGLFGELMEEELGGLTRLATNSDVNNLKEAGLDMDSQIDIVLGLAPTMLLFGGLGAASYYGPLAANKSKLRASLQSDAEKKLFDEVYSEMKTSSDFAKTSHDELYSILTAQGKYEFIKDLPKEQQESVKKTFMLGVINSYQGDLANKVYEARDKVNSEAAIKSAENYVNNVVYSSGNVVISTTLDTGENVYIVGGNVSTISDAEGNNIFDASKSSKKVQIKVIGNNGEISNKIITIDSNKLTGKIDILSRKEATDFFVDMLKAKMINLDTFESNGKVFDATDGSFIANAEDYKKQKEEEAKKKEEELADNPNDAQPTGKSTRFVKKPFTVTINGEKKDILVSGFVYFRTDGSIDSSKKKAENLVMSYADNDKLLKDKEKKEVSNQIQQSLRDEKAAQDAAIAEEEKKKQAEDDAKAAEQEHIEKVYDSVKMNDDGTFQKSATPEQRFIHIMGKQKQNLTTANKVAIDEIKLLNKEYDNVSEDEKMSPSDKIGRLQSIDKKRKEWNALIDKYVTPTQTVGVNIDDNGVPTQGEMPLQTDADKEKAEEYKVKAEENKKASEEYKAKKEEDKKAAEDEAAEKTNEKALNKLIKSRDTYKRKAVNSITKEHKLDAIKGYHEAVDALRTLGIEPIQSDEDIINGIEKSLNEENTASETTAKETPSAETSKEEAHKTEKAPKAEHNKSSKKSAKKETPSVEPAMPEFKEEPAAEGTVNIGVVNADHVGLKDNYKLIRSNDGKKYKLAEVKGKKYIDIDTEEDITDLIKKGTWSVVDKPNYGRYNDKYYLLVVKDVENTKKPVRAIPLNSYRRGMLNTALQSATDNSLVQDNSGSFTIDKSDIEVYNPVTGKFEKKQKKTAKGMHKGEGLGESILWRKVLNTGTENIDEKHYSLADILSFDSKSVDIKKRLSGKDFMHFANGAVKSVKEKILSCVNEWNRIIEDNNLSSAYEEFKKKNPKNPAVVAYEKMLKEQLEVSENREKESPIKIKYRDSFLSGNIGSSKEKKSNPYYIARQFRLTIDVLKEMSKDKELWSQKDEKGEPKYNGSCIDVSKLTIPEVKFNDNRRKENDATPNQESKNLKKLDNLKDVNEVRNNTITELEAARAELAELNEEQAKNKSERSERQKKLSNEISNLERQLKIINNRRKELRAKRNSSKKTIDQQIEEAKNNLNTSPKKEYWEGRLKKLESKKKEKESKENTLNESEKEIEDITKSINDLRRNISDIESAIIAADFSGNIKEVNRLNKTKAEIENQLIELRNKEAALMGEKAALMAEISDDESLNEEDVEYFEDAIEDINDSIEEQESIITDADNRRDYATIQEARKRILELQDARSILQEKIGQAQFNVTGYIPNNTTAAAFVTKALKMAGIKVHILDKAGMIRVFEENNDFKDAQKLRSTNGKVYGYKYKGEVYLNEDYINPNTPIHEYTHLWVDAYSKANPEQWKKDVDMLKKTPQWVKISRNPIYDSLDENGIASEVIAFMTGYYYGEVETNGKTRFENEIESGALDEGDMLNTLRLRGVRAMLRRIWQNVMDMFHSFRVGTTDKGATKKEENNLDEDIKNLMKMSMQDLLTGYAAYNDMTSASSESAFMTTYHGTAAVFDNFDFSFMSSGEGGQAFGWGGYVSKQKSVALHYATVSEINNYRRSRLEPGKKQLYSVEIPEDNGHNYLRLEEQVPFEDIEKIAKALAEQGYIESEDALLPDLYMDDSLGKDMYHYIESLMGDYKDTFGNVEDAPDKLTSEFLNSIGYVGVAMPIGAAHGRKYKNEDQMNYVLFNQNDMHINKRISVDDATDKEVAEFMVEDTGERVSKETLDAIDKERNAIIDKAKKDGTFMVAPNGKMSNLSEHEWVDVRTSRFKQWFGDWENGKVNENLLDENGEPVVVYHGTKKSGYSTFDVPTENGVGMGTSATYGLYTTTLRDAASVYAKSYDNASYTPDKSNAGIYELFVKMKNPKVIDLAEMFGEPKKWDMIPTGKYSIIVNDPELFDVYTGVESMEFDTVEEAEEVAYNFGLSGLCDFAPTYTSTDKLSKQARNEGYDGIIIKNVFDGSEDIEDGRDTKMKPMTDFVIFDNKQVKSATDNVGTYSDSENDALFMAVSAEDVFNIDKKRSEDLETSVEEAEKALANPAASNDFKIGKFAKAVASFLDRAAGAEVMRLSINQFNQEHGLPLLPHNINPRQALETAESKAGFRISEIERNEEAEFNNAIEDMVDIVKNSSMYKKFNKEQILDEGMEQTGKFIPLDPYRFVELYLICKTNLDDRAKRGVVRGNEEFILRTGVTMKEFLEEFDAEFGKKGTSESKAVVNLWNSIRKMTDISLEAAHDGQLITDRSYEEFKSRQFYVPLRGFNADEVDDNVDDTKVNSTPSQKLESMKRARGGKTLPSDVIAYIKSDVRDSIKKAENNKAKLNLYDMLRMSPQWCMKFNFPMPSRVYYKNVGGKWEMVKEAPSEEDIKLMESIKAEMIVLEKELEGDGTEEYKKAIIERLVELEAEMPYADEYTTGKLYREQHKKNLEKATTVGVMVDGVQHEIHLGSDQLSVANAFNDVYDTKNSGGFFKSLGNYIASQCTVNNPTFFAVNLVRDNAFICAKGFAELGLEFNARYAASFVECQRSLFRYMNGKDYEDSETGNMLREFFDNGAATGFSFVSDFDSFKDHDNLRKDKAFKLTKGIEYAKNDKAKWGIIARNLGHDADRVIGWFELRNVANYLNEYSDLISRFSIYKAVRDMGYDATYATHCAKNFTTNFNRKGVGNKFINFFNNLTIFANAAIQGACGYWRTYGGEYKGKHFGSWSKTVRALTSMAFGPAFLGFLNAELVPDDDADEFIVSDWERANYMIIGKDVRVPLNEQLKPFWNIGVNISMAMRGRRNMTQVASSIINSFMTNLVPVPQNLSGSSNMILNSMLGVDENATVINAVQNLITPTFLSTVNDLADNKTFFGGKLRYDYSNIPEHVMDDNEAKLYQDIAYLFYRVGGGMKYATTTYDKDGNKLSHLSNLNAKEVKAATFFIPNGLLDIYASAWGIGYAVKDTYIDDNGNSLKENMKNDVRGKDLPIINRFYKPTDNKMFRYMILKQAESISKEKNGNANHIEKNLFPSLSIKLDKSKKEGEKIEIGIEEQQEMNQYLKIKNDENIDKIKFLCDEYKELEVQKMFKGTGLVEKEVKKYYDDVDYDSIEDIQKDIIVRLIPSVYYYKGVIPTYDLEQLLKERFEENEKKKEQSEDKAE